jgi:hypothetical protein
VALALLVPGAAARAEAPIRVAILDFKDYPGPADASRVGMGASFGRLLGVAFGADAALSKRLQLVERSELRQVLDEKKLAAGLDPAATHTSGRLLGVSYFVTGGFEAFSRKRARKGVAMLKSHVVTTTATITVRFIDTRTAVQAFAFLVEAKSTDNMVAAEIKGPITQGEWGSQTEVGLFDELLTAAAKDAVKELKKNDRLRSLRPIERLGRVVKVAPKQVWISLGAQAGVTKGQRFAILRQGKPLVDRVSGKVLGTDDKEVAAGEAESVAELFSVVRLGKGVARVNDLVRPAPGDPGDPSATTSARR